MNREKLPTEGREVEVDENGVVLTKKEAEERRKKREENFAGSEQK